MSAFVFTIERASILDGKKGASSRLLETIDVTLAEQPSRQRLLVAIYGANSSMHSNRCRTRPYTPLSVRQHPHTRQSCEILESTWHSIRLINKQFMHASNLRANSYRKTSGGICIRTPNCHHPRFHHLQYKRAFVVRRPMLAISCCSARRM